MNGQQAVIAMEVAEKRVQQDRQWGGPEHDDQHRVHDWLGYIEHQVESARWDALREPQADRLGRELLARERLVNIAALAFAALESLERKQQQAQERRRRRPDLVERMEQIRTDRYIRRLAQVHDWEVERELERQQQEASASQRL